MPGPSVPLPLLAKHGGPLWVSTCLRQRDNTEKKKGIPASPNAKKGDAQYQTGGKMKGKRQMRDNRPEAIFCLWENARQQTSTDICISKHEFWVKIKEGIHMNTKFGTGLLSRVSFKTPLVCYHASVSCTTGTPRSVIAPPTQSTGSTLESTPWLLLLSSGPAARLSAPPPTFHRGTPTGVTCCTMRGGVCPHFSVVI